MGVLPTSKSSAAAALLTPSLSILAAKRESVQQRATIRAPSEGVFEAQ
jgi:hypothetical protein